MRTQLRRQAAAHTDHLRDVLKIQEQELKVEFEQVKERSPPGAGWEFGQNAGGEASQSRHFAGGNVNRLLEHTVGAGEGICSSGGDEDILQHVGFMLSCLLRSSPIGENLIIRNALTVNFTTLKRLIGGMLTMCVVCRKDKRLQKCV